MKEVPGSYAGKSDFLVVGGLTVSAPSVHFLLTKLHPEDDLIP